MQDDPDKRASRRAVVAGVTTGLAATLAAGAAAQTLNQAAAPPTWSGQSTLKDPVGEYPKPPFQKQHQDWPGLTSKMTPRPDHGEQSYKGSNRLLGRKALITGGDSGMGAPPPLPSRARAPMSRSTTCRPRSRMRRKWRC
jgi:hypothetical protein